MNHCGKIILFAICSIVFISCKKDDIKVNKESVRAGTSVTMKGEKLELYPGNLAVNDNLLTSLEPELADKIRGKVALIGVVPSLETKTCDAQAHALGGAKNLDSSIQRVIISRDIPFAQERFAKESHLENLTYYSDYKNGNFGRQHGLLIKANELLARSVIVVDKDGVIRYLQIVPEIVELPDMQKAIDVANGLVK